MSFAPPSPHGASPRGRRRLIYIAVAVGILVAGRLFGTRAPSRDRLVKVEGTNASASASAEPAPVEPLRHPPSAIAEFGILTARTEAELDARIADRHALGALVVPALCGGEAACAAVRETLEDEHATTLQVVPASNWDVEHLDLDASAPKLSRSLRASLRDRARLVVVHVATAPSPRQLALRAAIAGAAALAQTVDGLVDDQLLGRLETAHDFAAHAVTAGLDEPAFRRDRVEVVYEPKAGGVVRILTAGLARWGAPDVEAAAVPAAAGLRVADIVLGIAEAVAGGAGAPLRGPITLSRDDLARASGRPYPADDDLPPLAPIAVDVASVHPEGGDPNDFMARIEPADGHEPLGYLSLAERFFGSSLAASPGSAALRAAQDHAQRSLGPALARWAASRTRGAASKLMVRVPFAIAGDAGIESMWVELTAFDARSVTGKLVDLPLGATDFNAGDAVTRPRSDVEEIEER